MIAGALLAGAAPSSGVPELSGSDESSSLGAVEASEAGSLGPTGMTSGGAGIGLGGGPDGAACDEAASAEDAADVSCGCDDASAEDFGSADEAGSDDAGSADDAGSDDAASDEADGASDDSGGADDEGGSEDTGCSDDGGGADDDGSSDASSLGVTMSTAMDCGAAGSLSFISGGSSRTAKIRRCASPDTTAVQTIRRSRAGTAGSDISGGTISVTARP